MKLFVPKSGKQGSNVGNPSTTDLAGLLNLLYWCDRFCSKVQQSVVKKVRDRRNSRAHDPNLTLSNSDKESTFDEIDNLLKDAEYAGWKEARDLRQVILIAQKKNISLL